MSSYAFSIKKTLWMTSTNKILPNFLCLFLQPSSPDNNDVCCVYKHWRYVMVLRRHTKQWWLTKRSVRHLPINGRTHLTSFRTRFLLAALYKSCVVLDFVHIRHLTAKFLCDFTWFTQKTTPNLFKAPLKSSRRRLSWLTWFVSSFLTPSTFTKTKICKFPFHCSCMKKYLETNALLNCFY